MSETPSAARRPDPIGRVLAVCAGEESLAKRSLPEARITRFGIPGDVHFHREGRGEGPGAAQGPARNDRPITAVAAEAVRAACAALGIDVLPPGSLGENLLVEGLGDLSDLVPGDRLRVGGAGGPAPAVVLEVAKQNAPCRRLCSWHPGLKDAMVGRRGVICVVLGEGPVRPGDRVDVVRTRRPALPPIRAQGRR